MIFKIKYEAALFKLLEKHRANITAMWNMNQSNYVEPGSNLMAQSREQLSVTLGGGLVLKLLERWRVSWLHAVIERKS